QVAPPPSAPDATGPVADVPDRHPAQLVSSGMDAAGGPRADRNEGAGVERHPLAAGRAAHPRRTARPPRPAALLERRLSVLQRHGTGAGGDRPPLPRPRP